jgi:hypothetical protein
MMRPALWILPLALHATLAVGRQDLRLWGRVVDADGLPLEALVVAGGDSCHSDAFGNFAFPARPAGTIDLLVRPRGGEPFRKRIRLLREVFLSVEAPRARELLADLPGPAAELPGQHPAAGGLDLDGDGHREAPGWNPPGEALRHRRDGLEGTDPWGGWPGTVDAPLGREAARSWQPEGHPLFFSGSAGVLREAAPAAGAPWSASLWGGSGDLAGAGLQARLAAGPWQDLELEARREQRGHTPEGEGEGLVAGLRHRWLLPGPTLRHRLGLSRQQRSAAGPLDPLLWLPGASALELRHLDQTANEGSLDGRLSWPQREGLSVELGWQLGRRELETRALELDRVQRRTSAAGDTREVFFSTARTDRRQLQALEAALEKQHERGLLQIALSLREERREQRGSLLGVLGDPAVLPAGRVDRWWGADEQRVDVAARLRDRWRIRGVWWVDAALDLRYRYDKFDRLAVGNFALAAEPDLAFSSDLLSFEPRLALSLEGTTSLGELAWSRTRRPLEPRELWDGDQHPDALGGWPLLSPGDGFSSNELLLPHPLRERLSLAWWNPGPNRRGLRLAAERRREEPLSFAVPADGQWLESTVRQAAPERRQLGLDAWYGGELAGWRWSLALALRRGWADGLRRIPDGDGWTDLRPDATTWPGVPPAALWAGLARSWRPASIGLLDAALEGDWAAARAIEEWDSGPSLPARLRLNLRLGWRPAAWPAWGLSLGADNLLDDRTAEWGRLDRLEDRLSPRLWTVAPAERRFWLRLDWQLDGGSR